MNKRLLAISSAALTLIALSPAGPRADDMKLNFGFSCGPSISQVSYKFVGVSEHEVGCESRLGFSGGLVGRITLPSLKFVELESGMFFDMIGGKVNYVDFCIPAGDERTFKFNYVSVPFLIRISPLERDLRPFIKMGASVSALLSANINYRAWDEECYFLGKGEEGEYMEWFDISLLLGGGIEFVVDQYKIFLELVYSYGLMDVWESSIVRDVELKNRVIGIKLGVLM